MTERARHPLVVALFVLVTAEFLLVAGVTIYLVIEILATNPSSYASGIALIVITAAAAAWLAVIAVNILRGRAWVRAATIVWQVVQIALSLGLFQGMLLNPSLGWYLLVPAVAVLALVFTPPVVSALSTREGRE